MQETLLEGCAIYFEDADGVLEEVTTFRRIESDHVVPLVERLSDAARVLRDLEAQERNVKRELSRCLQVVRSTWMYTNKEIETTRSNMRHIYMELHRLNGLQERAKTAVPGFRLQTI